MSQQHLTPTLQGPTATSGLHGYSNICSIHSCRHTQTCKLKTNLLKNPLWRLPKLLNSINWNLLKSDILKTRSPLGDEKKPAPAPVLTSMCSYNEGDNNHCYKQTLEFRFSPERLCTSTHLWLVDPCQWCYSFVCVVRGRGVCLSHCKCLQGLPWNKLFEFRWKMEKIQGKQEEVAEIWDEFLPCEFPLILVLTQFNLMPVKVQWKPVT